MSQLIGFRCGLELGIFFFFNSPGDSNMQSRLRTSDLKEWFSDDSAH